MDHSASACTNVNQVKFAEGYVEEDAKYARDARNPNQSYQVQNTSYPTWDNSARQGQAPTVLPYRPPGYQEPAKSPATTIDDLKNLMMAISKH